MPGKRTSGSGPILNTSKARTLKAKAEAAARKEEDKKKADLLKAMALGKVGRGEGLDRLRELDPTLKGKDPGRTKIKYGPGTDSIATRFVKDMTYNNPFVGTLGAAAAVPSIVKNPKQAAKGLMDQIRHPIRSAKENPFSALSLVAGAGVGAAAGTRTALRAADREIARDFDKRNPYDLNDPSYGRDQRRTIPLNKQGWTLRRTDPSSPHAFGVTYTSDKKRLSESQPFTVNYNVVDPKLRVHGSVDYSIPDRYSDYNYVGEMFTSKAAQRHAPNALREMTKQAYLGGGAKQLESQFANPKLGRAAHKMGTRLAREINAKHDSVYKAPSDYDMIRQEYHSRHVGADDLDGADPWEASQDPAILDGLVERLDMGEDVEEGLFRSLQGTHPDYMHGVIGNAVQQNLLDPLDAEDLMESLMSTSDNTWTPKKSGNRAKWEKEQIASYVKNPNASYDASAQYGQMTRPQALAKLMKEGGSRVGSRIAREERGAIGDSANKWAEDVGSADLIYEALNMAQSGDRAGAVQILNNASFFGADARHSTSAAAFQLSQAPTDQLIDIVARQLRDDLRNRGRRPRRRPVRD